MLGRFEEAWAIALPAGERARELRRGGDGSNHLAEIAALAGDHATAAGYLRRAATCSSGWHRAWLSTYAPAARPLAVRARPLRRGGAARAARPRARQRPGLRHADALAAGAGTRPRPPRRARPGRAARPRGGRDRRRNGRSQLPGRRALRPRRGARRRRPHATRPPPRSSRRSSATSARRTWPWSPRCGRSSSSCAPRR